MNIFKRKNTVYKLSVDEAVAIVSKSLDSAGISYENKPALRRTTRKFIDPAVFDDKPEREHEGIYSSSKNPAPSAGSKRA